MNRRPPTSTRPNTPFPSPTVFRAHHLPRRQPRGGFHTAAVDADLALAQQLLEAPVGHLGKVLAEPTVEALAGGCRLHRDLTHASHGRTPVMSEPPAAAPPRRRNRRPTAPPRPPRRRRRAAARRAHRAARSEEH